MYQTGFGIIVTHRMPVAHSVDGGSRTATFCFGRDQAELRVDLPDGADITVAWVAQLHSALVTHFNIPKGVHVVFVRRCGGPPAMADSEHDAYALLTPAALRGDGNVHFDLCASSVSVSAPLRWGMYRPPVRTSAHRNFFHNTAIMAHGGDRIMLSAEPSAVISEGGNTVALDVLVEAFSCGPCLAQERLLVELGVNEAWDVVSLFPGAEERSWMTTHRSGSSVGLSLSGGYPAGGTVGVSTGVSGETEVQSLIKEWGCTSSVFNRVHSEPPTEPAVADLHGVAWQLYLQQPKLGNFSSPHYPPQATSRLSKHFGITVKYAGTGPLPPSLRVFVKVSSVVRVFDSAQPVDARKHHLGWYCRLLGHDVGRVLAPPPVAVGAFQVPLPNTTHGYLTPPRQVSHATWEMHECYTADNEVAGRWQHPLAARVKPKWDAFSRAVSTGVRKALWLPPRGSTSPWPPLLTESSPVAEALGQRSQSANFRCDEAIELCNNADNYLIFLGHGAEGRRLGKGDRVKLAPWAAGGCLQADDIGEIVCIDGTSRPYDVRNVVTGLLYWYQHTQLVPLDINGKYVADFEYRPPYEPPKAGTRVERVPMKRQVGIESRFGTIITWDAAGSVLVADISKTLEAPADGRAVPLLAAWMQLQAGLAVTKDLQDELDKLPFFREGHVQLPEAHRAAAEQRFRDLQLRVPALHEHTIGIPEPAPHES